MKRNQKLVCLLFLGLFVLSSNFVIAADNTDLYSSDPDIQELNKRIEDNNNEIANLKKAADEYRDKIEEYSTRSASLQNQLELLDNQVIKVQIDIKTNQLEIDKTKLEIDSLNYQIEKQETELEKQKTNLIEYLKLINQNDQKSYLEILILNDSFAEFFNQLNYLEEVQTNIQQTVERLKILKESISLQKENQQRYREELDQLKLDLAEREEKLIEDQRAKEILLGESLSTEQEFEKLLVQTKQQQNSIETKILDYQQQIKDKIIRLRSGSTSPKTTLLDWPVPSPHVITTYFHDPDYPFRYIFEHPAIDVRAAQGTPIKSPAPGYVARTVDAGYGYSYIILIHDNGISTVYGHVSAIYVKEDSFVQTGDVIGLTGGAPGSKGAGNLTTGPHLHFEVRLNGIPVNPLEYLP